MSEPSGSSNPYRLPRNATPSRYDLTLTPDLDGGTFTGTAVITLDVQEATHDLVLNAAELAFDAASIVDAGGTLHELTAEFHDEFERATLTTSGDVIAAGAATLTITFRGILNDKLRGFYRSTFTDTDGNQRTLATTQFESTDARRAFPCWDEPDFKAVFGVTLIVPDDLLAISNGREIERTPVAPGVVQVRFADTMIMSTYLVAFVVGPLEATEAVDVDGVPLRVVHPLGKADLAPFGLAIGESALRYFADYYAIPYPGDKVDLVAIPDFAFGAMENLGCITFRETALLVDPKQATQPELERVADVVAHELAHMWFGDLVTMDWWTGIWLNEAFATFMEMKAVDNFRADWKRWSTFALSRSAAFDTDALAATRPIEYEVLSPSDAEGMFDILTYEKGASVLRMLEQYLGEDPFRDGIRRYLATHSYGNTVTTDLWDALESVTGSPVRRVADTWIYQGGHPVITVSYDHDAHELVLAQRGFRYIADATFTDLWEVPVGLRVAEATGTVRDIDVLVNAASVRVPLDTAPQWVVANRNASGFFRTEYSPELLGALGEVALDVLDATERYTLIDDTWSALLSGTTDAAAFLSLVKGMAEETDLSVWRRIVGSVSTLMRVANDDGRAALRTFAQDLFAPAFARLGEAPRTDESEHDTNVRATLFEALGSLADDPVIIDRAEALVDAILDGATDVDPSLGDAAVRIAAERLDDARFDQFLAASEAADTPQTTLRFLASLCDAHDPAIFARLLALLLSDRVRTQDAGGLLNRALTNRVNAAAAWQFATDNWDVLIERLPTNAVSRMITGIRTVSDAELAASIESFLADHPVPQATKAFTQHIERMHVTTALAARESARLAAAVS